MSDMQQFMLAPSILSADFARLGEAMQVVEEAGAGLIHVDVMDGQFVPNITIGVPVVESLRRSTEMVLDVHLMIDEPGRWVDDFVKAGADMVSVHAEAGEETRAVVFLLDRALSGRTALNVPATWGLVAFEGAAHEALEVLLRESERADVRAVGARGLLTKVRVLGDVRGLGLYLGIELVEDPETREPAAEEQRDPRALVGELALLPSPLQAAMARQVVLVDGVVDAAARASANGEPYVHVGRLVADGALSFSVRRLGVVDDRVDADGT